MKRKTWIRINRKRTNLPKRGFVVAGSYDEEGSWTMSSVSCGNGYPFFADAERTHFYRLCGPLPKPPNEKGQR